MLFLCDKIVVKMKGGKRMHHDDLEEIYKKYFTPLFLFAFSLSKNEEDAKDLVANTFVKAFLSYEKGNLKAWLYTVLKNEYYNLYKKRKRLIDEGKLDMTLLQFDLNVLNEVIHNEEKQWLYKQIYRLNDRDRNVLLLSIQKDLKDSEIAQILNLTTEHVRVIKNRAKKKLIELYQKEEKS